ILGVAYKKDISDARESPIFPILDLLQQKGANWKTVDPYVNEFRYQNTIICPEKDVTDEMLDNADLVLIATNHSVYDYKFILEKSKVVFDTRNSYDRLTNADNYYK